MLALPPTQHTVLHPNTCAAVYEACTYTESTHFFFCHPFLTWMYSSDEDSSVEEEEQQHQHVRKMMFVAAFTMTVTFRILGPNTRNIFMILQGFFICL